MKEYRWYGPPPLDLPRENPSEDYRLEALTHEISELVQDPSIYSELTNLGSIPGHCAAAVEAMWILVKYDPRFQGLVVKQQTLKPRKDPKHGVVHRRLYDPINQKFYDPTLYQFKGEPIEVEYDPFDPKLTKFGGAQSIRTSQPPYYTNRHATIYLLKAFYQRFPENRRLQVISDTRVGPQLQLVSDPTISTADQALFDNTLSLIGREVEVHTNRTKKIWSIKDPFDNDRLIGYAKDSVTLRDVKWTQPTLGVARRTYHQTESGARTGERSVQAFAQGILVAFDGIPVSEDIKREMDSCGFAQLTYRPTNDSPEWVGAFRERDSLKGVQSSKFAKLDWVTLADGKRVADAKAYCEIGYIDPSVLEAFRQEIIRENGDLGSGFKAFVRTELSEANTFTFDTYAQSLAQQVGTDIDPSLYPYIGVLNEQNVLIGVMFVTKIDSPCFSFEIVIAPQYEVALSNSFLTLASFTYDLYKQQRHGELQYCIQTEDPTRKADLEAHGFIVYSVDMRTQVIWYLAR